MVLYLRNLLLKIKRRKQQWTSNYWPQDANYNNYFQIHINCSDMLFHFELMIFIRSSWNKRWIETARCCVNSLNVKISYSNESYLFRQRKVRSLISFNRENLSGFVYFAWNEFIFFDKRISKFMKYMEKLLYLIFTMKSEFLWVVFHSTNY